MTRTEELAATILAGINAHRYLPDDWQITEAERVLLQQGAVARIDARVALRELVEIVGKVES